MAASGSFLKRFWNELRRRKVVQVTIVYAVVGWVLIQIAEATFEPLQLPEWAATLVIALIALGFPLAVVLAWAYDITPEGVKWTPTAEVGAEEAPGEERQQDQPGTSIAVLAFADMSPDQDQTYFCEGMAEEILNSLTRLAGIHVASRTSSFRYRRSALDVREIGRELGVGSVLEGSVRKSGDQLRVTVQLIDVASGYHVWSERYDRSVAEVFSLQDDIACNVMEALKLKLSPSERKSIRRPSTSRTEAYEYYLRGRQYFHRITREGYKYAQQMFERAIEIDPDYAFAHAGLAHTHSFAFMYTDCSRRNLDRANEASTRALELDPELSDAHTAKGLALSLAGQTQAAEKEFETAIRLDPKDFEAFYFYGRDCFAHGRYEKAIELYEQAEELRPEHYTVFPLMGQTYGLLGRDEDAERARQRGLKVLTRYVELNPDDVRATYLRATTLAELGQCEEARQWARRALALAPDDPAVLYNVACVRAVVGDTEEAISHLARALDAGFAHLGWLERDPQLDNIRDDPRFEPLLQRLR